MQRYLSIVQTALEISGCTDLGFRVGKHHAALDQGTFGYALLSSATLGESLSRYTRFQHMMGSSIPIKLTLEGEQARITVAPSQQKILLSESQVSYLTQEWLAGWNLWRPLIGEPAGFFKHAYLGYQESCDPEVYTSHLGCPVSFGHKQTAAVFPVSYLEREQYIPANSH